jgi:hypothetical protein
LIVLIGNNIRARGALRRLILAFKVDLEIFDEVLKPFLDVESSENIIKLVFNLETILPF